MENISLKRISDLSGLEPFELVEESKLAGYRHVVRLVEDYNSGINTFDKQGEVLLGAFDKQRLIGICGLNQEPYNLEPGIGRLRRMYVLHEYRRMGIGRILVNEITRLAQDQFKVLVLHTENKEAEVFYTSLGFLNNNRYENVSHYKLLDPTAELNS